MSTPIEGKPEQIAAESKELDSKFQEASQAKP